MHKYMHSRVKKALIVEKNKLESNLEIIDGDIH